MIKKIILFLVVSYITVGYFSGFWLEEGNYSKNYQKELMMFSTGSVSPGLESFYKKEKRIPNKEEVKKILTKSGCSVYDNICKYGVNDFIIGTKKEINEKYILSIGTKSYVCESILKTKKGYVDTFCYSRSLWNFLKKKYFDK